MVYADAAPFVLIYLRPMSSDPAASTLERFRTESVERYASIGILACSPDTPLAEVAWLMANNRVHAVLVTSDESATPPVISDADLVAAAASAHFDELRASDIAITEPVSVDRDETLERAAQLLAEHAVTHLIVTEGGRPVGILSALDLARAAGGAEAG